MSHDTETPPQKPPPNKKPRIKKHKPDSRRGGVAYSKAPLRSSLSITPRKQNYPVFTSNNGLYEIATVIYNHILQFDERIAGLISHLQMAYVATIAYCYRISNVSIFCGYTSGVVGYSLLQQMGSGILLPEFLARYIEAIGKITSPTGVTIVPFAGNYRHLFPIGTAVTLDPAEILLEANRLIPDNPWVIDTG